MNTEAGCLIDFDPFPKCPEIAYDPHFDTSPWYDFEEDYACARAGRLHQLTITMRQRVLTQGEEIEAFRLGAELTQGDERAMAEVWFHQRRLQMLAKGVIPT